MPICVDESFVNAEEAAGLFEHPELRCAMVKIGKFGGIERSLAFVHRALAEGREVCMSGMYDTGVSRFAHAAFQTLPEWSSPAIWAPRRATSTPTSRCLPIPPPTASSR
mgnify:CR=1 FL=1